MIVDVETDGASCISSGVETGESSIFSGGMAMSFLSL